MFMATNFYLILERINKMLVNFDDRVASIKLGGIYSSLVSG